MKNGLFLVLALLVSLASAERVKSKRGSVDLVKAKGSSDVVCQADFSDEMTVVKKDGDYALVKGSCGQGWVPMDKVEKVAAAAGDKSMKLDGVDVVGWLDNPQAVFVLDENAADFDGVDINRDFREYLQHTLDKENIERTNQEN